MRHPTLSPGDPKAGFVQNIAPCLSDEIGPGGLAPERLNSLCAGLDPALARLRAAREGGALPYLTLPDARDDLEAMRPIAVRYRERFDDVVILGTGGSSLGGSALLEMADREPSEKQGGDGGGGGGGGGDKNSKPPPRLHIITNVDPFVFERLIRRLDMGRTGLVVISKSGATTETMMQFMRLLSRMRAHIPPAALQDHILLVCEPGDNGLRRIGRRLGLMVLDHDPRLGGRYSVLSVVGMLPALIAGLDAAAVRDGARAVLDQALAGTQAIEVPAALGAAVSVGLARERGIASTVMLAYSDRLGSLARWYRQLWAESLGKNGKGTTPIYGTGPVDQHSQLQLWLDGPADKMFTVLGGPDAHGGVAVGSGLGSLPGGDGADDPALAPIMARSLGELMEASRRATADSLIARGRPVRTITMTRIDERAMGALMMHFMLETVLAAELLGVDPFDQPAVEDNKIRIRAYLAAMHTEHEPHRQGEKP